ncbi:hypothetical protein [Escherichia coli]|uniref:hypothetical protein n=1 Tax=Escherichia coli TaxID=562 RepID=UPI0019196811|nr:hypothetical protein [Escherichia coli]CAD6037104.1 Uncharacterised protein [Escherichia coli]CAD6099223.1 Uncharacterised protein [Escherichia coli]CAD6176234.1 Uncharacterised protein [Escherichia coli]
MPDISFNPFKTHGAPDGMFNVESRGLTQGDAQDDPAIRLQLCSGTLKSTDPVWAGAGVIECVSTADMNIAGSTILPASDKVCNAFTVSNQAYHSIITPGNNVPLYVDGGSVHYFRIGSGARIPLPVSAAVAALATGSEPVASGGFVWNIATNEVDVATVAGNPAISIKLLMVSPTGNLTVKKDASGAVVWENDKPCGLFLI